MTNQTKSSTGRVYGGVSQEERKKLRKQQFIQAGVDIFGTEGFRKATVRKLCKQAQLTDRYFYQSFGSVEALLIATYEHLMTESSKRMLINASQVEMKGGLPVHKEDFITTSVDGFLEYMQNPKIAKICMTEMEGVSEESNRVYNGYIERYAEIAMVLADKVYPKWNISADERKMLGIAMIGSMRQLTTFWYQSDYQMPRDQLSKVACDVILGAAQFLNHQNGES